MSWWVIWENFFLIKLHKIVAHKNDNEWSGIQQNDSWLNNTQYNNTLQNGTQTRQNDTQQNDSQRSGT